MQTVTVAKREENVIIFESMDSSPAKLSQVCLVNICNPSTWEIRVYDHVRISLELEDSLKDMRPY